MKATIVYKCPTCKGDTNLNKLIKCQQCSGRGTLKLKLYNVLRIDEFPEDAEEAIIVKNEQINLPYVEDNPA